MTPNGPKGPNGSNGPNSPNSPKGLNDPIQTDSYGQPWDPGLQPERTSLSWQRTVLAMAILFVVTTRLLLTVPFAAAVVASAGVLGCAGLAALIRRASRHREQRLRAGNPAALVVEPALTVALVVALAGVAFWGIIAG